MTQDRGEAANASAISGDRHRVQGERLVLTGAGASHADVRLTAVRAVNAFNAADNGDARCFGAKVGLRGIPPDVSMGEHQFGLTEGFPLYTKRGRPGINPTCHVVC